MLNKQKLQGFTLIELIVVIVILGILAGVAVPRFINQTTRARTAAINGLLGSLQSAVALAQTQYVAEGNTSSSTATSIDMNGTTIQVVRGTGAPSAANLSGATGVLSSLSGFTPTVGTNTTSFALNGGPPNCSVVYVDGSGTTPVAPTISATVTGC